MLPNIQTIYELSEKLRIAVIKTLGLDEKEKVFAGNEEKLFLFVLFENLPDSDHPTSTKIYDYKNVTNYRMVDIWSGEIAKRKNEIIRHSLSQSIRNLIIAARNLILKIKYYAIIQYRLNHNKNLIHFAAHLRYTNYIIPNLTNYFFKNENEKDFKLREIFYYNMGEAGIDSKLKEYLKYLFPTSHLESYFELKNHKISGYQTKTIATSIYGIMEDPLISFLVKKSECKLVYIQHGGGYGLNSNSIKWQIEKDGSDIMYFWGTGNNNVYPTRYRNKYFPKIKNKLIFILSDKHTQESISFYTELQEKVINNYGLNSTIVSHPNGPRFKNGNIQYGIGNRQHEQAQLIIFDRPGNSFLYARILTKRPFIILEGDYELNPETENAAKFLYLLREEGILINRLKLEDKINYWMNLKPKHSQIMFEKSARKFLRHVLKQPKLIDLLNKGNEFAE